MRKRSLFIHKNTRAVTPYLNFIIVSNNNNESTNVLNPYEICMKLTAALQYFNARLYGLATQQFSGQFTSL